MHSSRAPLGIVMALLPVRCSNRENSFYMTVKYETLISIFIKSHGRENGTEHLNNSDSFLLFIHPRNIYFTAHLACLESKLLSHFPVSTFLIFIFLPYLSPTFRRLTVTPLTFSLNLDLFCYIFLSTYLYRSGAFCWFFCKYQSSFYIFFYSSDVSFGRQMVLTFYS